MKKGPVGHPLARVGHRSEAGGLDEGQAAPREGRQRLRHDWLRRPLPAARPPPLLLPPRALDTELDLESGADRDRLDRALDGHVLETAELVGGYER